MNSQAIFVIVFSLVLVGTVIFVLINQLQKLKKELKGESDPILMEWLKQMKESVDKTSTTLDTQLRTQREAMEQNLKNQRDTINQQMNNQTKLIWERMDNATEVIKKVEHQLGGIQEFGKDIKDLSNVLKSPKMRGGLGEQFLYDILANYLPNELYKTQFKFKNGATCDAVIFTDKGIIPVDSKFPMENFKASQIAETEIDREKFKKVFISDVKKRIDEISDKYILPEENTTEQAVMYIPSESVFYELIVNSPQIEDYAMAKNVVMVSPNTLSYFVKIVLVAYQQKSLEKHAGTILKAVDGIKLEAERFVEDLGVLERHISNSYKSMDTVKTKFGKVYTKIESAHAIEGEIEKAVEIPLLD